MGRLRWAIWMAGLLAVSAVSQFDPRPPEGAVVDLRIATMLTPSGLLREHVWERNSPLMPYYGLPPKRAGFSETPLLLVVYLIWAGAGITLFLKRLQV